MFAELVLMAAVAHGPTTIQEDSPSYDCRTSGNHICGPGNSNGVRAGLYSAKNNGHLIITWRHLKEWGPWSYGPPANADDGFKAKH